MRVEDAHTIVQKHLTFEEGRFFGPSHGLSLGVGLIAQGIVVPEYDVESARFRTFETSVFLLSHECDLSQENIRPFNDHALVCPIISFEVFVATYCEKGNDEQLANFLAQLAANNVSRVVYLPCYDVCDYGGLLYLNKITSTHISCFQRDSAALMSAITEYGLRYIDLALERHLRRPKGENLPGHN